MSKVQRYVVLPTRGLRASTPSSSPTLASFLTKFEGLRTVAAAKSFAAKLKWATKPVFRVIDSIHEDGAKLVEMTLEAAKELLAQQPGLRIVPLLWYRRALARYEITGKLKAAAHPKKLTVAVVSKADDTPIKGALVVAFTDFENGFGAQATTGADGKAKLTLGTAASVERLYVYPKKNFWSALRKDIALPAQMDVELEPVALDFTDGLRHFYGQAADGAGNGVTVAVVDAGVGPHADLVVAGGLNTVEGEEESDFGDNGDGHGTHVAGIVAARGTPPSGLRGVAPAVVLRSYRVFGKGAEGASNFAIAKAIDRAVADQCDLINLSLGGGPSDPATQSAIHDARQQGSVVIAATGNDGRAPVSFPAADPLCVAVSALGRKGTFPKGTAEEGDIAPPSGDDAKDFIAAFSNIGPEVDVTGTGVGILSTVPDGYVPMSGTSMACPAVTGFAAALLGQRPDLLNMPRAQERSDAIVAALLQAAQSRGFQADLQGLGLPLA